MIAAEVRGWAPLARRDHGARLRPRTTGCSVNAAQRNQRRVRRQARILVRKRRFIDLGEQRIKNVPGADAVDVGMTAA